MYLLAESLVVLLVGSFLLRSVVGFYTQWFLFFGVPSFSRSPVLICAHYKAFGLLAGPFALSLVFSFDCVLGQ